MSGGKVACPKKITSDLPHLLHYETHGSLVHYRPLHQRDDWAAIWFKHYGPPRPYGQDFGYIWPYGVEVCSILALWASRCWNFVTIYNEQPCIYIVDVG
jgi:hypothetical protein